VLDALEEEADALATACLVEEDDDVLAVLEAGCRDEEDAVTCLVRAEDATSCLEDDELAAGLREEEELAAATCLDEDELAAGVRVDDVLAAIVCLDEDAEVAAGRWGVVVSWAKASALGVAEAVDDRAADLGGLLREPSVTG
jgi:hypothetical protein